MYSENNQGGIDSRIELNRENYSPIFDLISKLKQPLPIFKFKQGENVFLSISSEIPDEAHLHGYDLSTRMELDSRGEIKFIVSKTGRFPIELERKGNSNY